MRLLAWAANKVSSSLPRVLLASQAEDPGQGSSYWFCMAALGGVVDFDVRKVLKRKKASRDWMNLHLQQQKEGANRCPQAGRSHCNQAQRSSKHHGNRLLSPHGACGVIFSALARVMELAAPLFSRRAPPLKPT
jgi:hypothetical protein